MEVLFRKCAGLEVREAVVVGCVRVMIGHKVVRERLRVARTARGVFALGDWLAKHAVSHVGIEGTGAGWKSVYWLLAGRFELVLVDARELGAVGGRAADFDDATWLAEVLAHGLVRGRVAVPEAVADLHVMIETREQFARDRVQHARWILELIESFQLKLATVTSDVIGPAGRALLDALIGGEEDPGRLAGLAQGVLRARRGTLMGALPGRIQDHHRYLLGSHLRLIESLEEGIAALEVDIDRILGSGSVTTQAQRVEDDGQAAEGHGEGGHGGV